MPLQTSRFVKERGYASLVELFPSLLGIKEGRAPWQVLVSSSRTSTSSYDSWDSYPASIQSQSRSDLKPREGATVVSRLSQALDCKIKCYQLEPFYYSKLKEKA